MVQVVGEHIYIEGKVTGVAPRSGPVHVKFNQGLIGELHFAPGRCASASAGDGACLEFEFTRAVFLSWDRQGKPPPPMIFLKNKTILFSGGTRSTTCLFLLSPE